MDSLSRMTMGIVSHLDEAKKELTRELHRLARLGVMLETFLDQGAIIYHNSKSSLVVDVNSKQHLDLALMELKELVLDMLLRRGRCVKVQRDIMCTLCRWVEKLDPRRSTLIPLLNSSVVDKNVP